MTADSTNRTYVFQDDKVYAMENGKVVAAADDVEELEDQDQEDDSDDSNNESNDESNDSPVPEEDDKKEATHIVTPGGLKGKIISRTAGLWSDEIAVRLENGNIAHYPVLADTEFVTEREDEVANPLVALEERLHIDYDESKDSLVSRRVELSEINRQARDLIQKGASTQDVERLDKISIQAEDEQQYVDDRLEALEQEEGEGFVPPAPYETQVVEQAGVGGGDSSWLETTLDGMIQEAEGFDYQNYMNEGPEALISEIDDAPLADQGAVQSIAASAVREKTAAADPDVRDKYEKEFLARVEEVRRAEVKNRKETVKKQAAAQEDENSSAPDESLFL